MYRKRQTGACSFNKGRIWTQLGLWNTLACYFTVLCMVVFQARSCLIRSFNSNSGQCLDCTASLQLSAIQVCACAVRRDAAQSHWLCHHWLFDNRGVENWTNTLDVMSASQRAPYVRQYLINSINTDWWEREWSSEVAYFWCKLVARTPVKNYLQPTRTLCCLCDKNYNMQLTDILEMQLTEISNLNWPIFKACS